MAVPYKDPSLTPRERTEDLLYRINTFEIYIPSLKERIEDIELLVDFFLAQFQKQYNKPGLKALMLTVSGSRSYPKKASRAAIRIADIGRIVVS